jgi:ribonuclease HII
MRVVELVPYPNEPLSTVPAWPMPEADSPTEPRVLGIDEAGRGSLVGPLVVGGFLTTVDAASRLGSLGVRDSKELTPRQRSEAYRAIGRVGQRFSISLAPAEIDRHVAHGLLNALEAHAFARIVASARADLVYVDSCDPVAERFGETVRRLSGRRAHVVSRHEADRTIPVVSAASIVAKVRRDRALAKLREGLGERLGSGYPSDVRTVEFVREYLREGPSNPVWLRRSWRTMERIKPQPAARTLDAFVR